MLVKVLKQPLGISSLVSLLHRNSYCRYLRPSARTKQRNKQSTVAHQRFDKCPDQSVYFPKFKPERRTFVGSYNVDWFYLGSESDNKNDFAANGVALANGGVIGYQEINANNNCIGCSVVFRRKSAPN